MQAVILAAGLGTRMGDLTRQTPKALLKIQGKTIIEGNLSEIPRDIDEVILVVGYLGEQIKALVGDHFLGKKIKYIFQEKLNGTAHALYLCKDVLRNNFLVLMGDDLYARADLEKLIKHNLALLAWEMKNDDLVDHYQAVLKLDNAGNLLDIIERQSAGRGVLVNAGAYVLDTKLFHYPMVSAGTPATEYGLPQTFVQLVKDKEEIKVVKASFWHKVASPGDLFL